MITIIRGRFDQSDKLIAIYLAPSVRLNAKLYGLLKRFGAAAIYCWGFVLIKFWTKHLCGF